MKKLKYFNVGDVNALSEQQIRDLLHIANCDMTDYYMLSPKEREYLCKDISILTALLSKY